MELVSGTLRWETFSASATLPFPALPCSALLSSPLLHFPPLHIFFLFPSVPCPHPFLFLSLHAFFSSFPPGWPGTQDPPPPLPWCQECHNSSCRSISWCLDADIVDPAVWVLSWPRLRLPLSLDNPFMLGSGMGFLVVTHVGPSHGLVHTRCQEYVTAEGHLP